MTTRSGATLISASPLTLIVCWALAEQAANRSTTADIVFTESSCHEHVAVKSFLSVRRTFRNPGVASDKRLDLAEVGGLVGSSLDQSAKLAAWVLDAAASCIEVEGESGAVRLALRRNASHCNCLSTRRKCR